MPARSTVEHHPLTRMATSILEGGAAADLSLMHEHVAAVLVVDRRACYEAKAIAGIERLQRACTVAAGSAYALSNPIGVSCVG